MKKLFYLLTAFIFLSHSLAYGSTIKEDDKTKIDLSKENPHNTGEKERSVANVEAFLYTSQNKVEIELFDVGEADITILNSLGHVVSSDVVLANFPTSVTLYIPSDRGLYYIIIDSDEIYAQGCFVL